MYASTSSWVQRASGCTLTIARRGVPPDDRGVRPGRRLVPAHPAHPGRERRQRPAQRLHLAQPAAPVRVPLVQPGHQVGVLLGDRPQRHAPCARRPAASRRPRPGCRSSRRSGSRCRGSSTVTPGRARPARWASTASVIDDDTHSPSPKVSRGPAQHLQRLRRPPARAPPARRGRASRSHSSCGALIGHLRPLGDRCRFTARSAKARRQASHRHSPCVSPYGRRPSSPQYGQKNGTEPGAYAWLTTTTPRRPAPRTRRSSPRARGAPGSRAAPARRSRPRRPPRPSARGTCGRTRPRRPSCPPRCTWKTSTSSPSAPRATEPLKPMSATWKRAQEFGQPLTLMRHRLGEVRQPPLQLRVQVLRPGPWSRRSPACRTRCRCRPSCRSPERARAHRQVRGRQLGDQRLGTVRGHVEDDQLLLGGGADAALAVLVGQVGDPGQLGAGARPTCSAKPTA